MLYASDNSAVYAWPYIANSSHTGLFRSKIITGLEGKEHVTRTLLTSRKVPGMLLVSRGSGANIDLAALDISNQVSTIKAFDISKLSRNQTYNYVKDGVLLGWGLRNSVGMDEHPSTGGIWSVENSADNINRTGVDIHQNNPAEELNFHGYLNGTETEEQGGNYGYPHCYAAWNVSEIPGNEGIEVGEQFAADLGDVGIGTVDDKVCREERVEPRLSFAAHMAPLDIKFNGEGTAAWVTFHGSWYVDYSLPIPFPIPSVLNPSHLHQHNDHMRL